MATYAGILFVFCLALLSVVTVLYVYVETSAMYVGRQSDWNSGLAQTRMEQRRTAPPRSPPRTPPRLDQAAGPAPPTRRRSEELAKIRDWAHPPPPPPLPFVRDRAGEASVGGLVSDEEEEEEVTEAAAEQAQLTDGTDDGGGGRLAVAPTASAIGAAKEPPRPPPPPPPKTARPTSAPDRPAPPLPPPPPPPPSPPPAEQQQARPDQVLILGMHHSGTSLLMQAALSMGLYGGFFEEFQSQQPPKELRPTGPPDWWPAKWWERHDVVNVNLMLMQPFLDERDKWRAGFHYAGFSEVSKPTQRVFDYRAKKIVERLDQRRPWVIKEPRLCITMGNAWRRHLTNPVCIIIYRHPQLVTAGLLRHWPKVNRQFSAAEWLALWEKYVLSSLRGCRGLPTAFVSHELLTLDPWRAVSLLAEHLQLLGVPVDLNNTQYTAAREKQDGMRKFSESTIRSIFQASFFQAKSNQFEVPLSASQHELFKLLDRGDFSARLTNDSVGGATFRRLKPFLFDEDRPLAKQLPRRSGFSPALSLAAGFASVFQRDDDRQTVVRPEDTTVDEQGLRYEAIDDEPDNPSDYRPWWSPNKMRSQLARDREKEQQQQQQQQQKQQKGGKKVLQKKPSSAALEKRFVGRRKLLSVREEDGDGDLVPEELRALLAQAAQSSGRASNSAGLVVAVYGNSAFVPLIRNWLCHARAAAAEPRKLVVFALDAEVCSLLLGRPPASTTGSDGDQAGATGALCWYDADWWRRQSSAVSAGDGARAGGLAGHARWRDTVTGSSGGGSSSDGSTGVLPSRQRYFQMLLFKMRYAQLVVDAGYDLVLSDADTVFFEDPARAFFEAPEQPAPLRALPAPHAGQLAAVDLIIQSDARSVDARSDRWVCAGNFWLRASPRARQFVRAVVATMEATGLSDQDAFQLLLTNETQSGGADARAAAAHAAAAPAADVPFLRTRVLDPLVYPNGGTYFVDELPQRLGITVQFVHANMFWDKEASLRKHKLWRQCDLELVG